MMAKWYQYFIMPSIHATPEDVAPRSFRAASSNIFAMPTARVTPRRCGHGDFRRRWIRRRKGLDLGTSGRGHVVLCELRNVALVGGNFRGGGVHCVVLAAGEAGGGDECDDADEAFEEHCAVADGAGVGFLVEHFGGGAGG